MTGRWYTPAGELYLTLRQCRDQVLHAHPHALDPDNPHHGHELGAALKNTLHIKHACKYATHKKTRTCGKKERATVHMKNCNASCTFSGAKYLTFSSEIAMARPVRAIEPVHTPRVASIS